MKTFESGPNVRSITEILDSTLHVKALRVQLDTAHAELLDLHIRLRLALSEVNKLQIENVAMRDGLYKLETQVKELREMLAARGEALGLGNP